MRIHHAAIGQPLRSGARPVFVAGVILVRTRSPMRDTARLLLHHGIAEPHDKLVLWIDENTALMEGQIGEVAAATTTLSVPARSAS